MQKIDFPIKESASDSIKLPASQPEELSKKRSRDDWRRVLQDWQNSGLTRKEFCTRNNIILHQFTYYRDIFRKEAGCDKKLIPLKITNQVMQVSATAFILHLQNGAKLSIPSIYDESSLRQLLNILGVCS